MDDSHSDSGLDIVSYSTSSGCLDELSSEDDSNGATSRKKNNINLLKSICFATVSHFQNYMNKTPSHNREYSGWAALMSILNGNPRRCKENLRMKIDTFFQLCTLLVEEYNLKPMRSVTIEEQVATFMMLVGPRVGNRQCQETFQRSGFTISKSFHRVLEACIRMSLDWVVPFSDHSVTPNYIRLNERYYPHFKDCIGAIDGTHIKAQLPKEAQVPFIGRKQIPTQNIMVACDFDLCFTFVLPGWEGSAHDTRIFYDTIRNPRKKFPMPPQGKYYLVDAGYPNIPGFLAPYKGTKYHLPDFNRANVYNNEHEMFNHIHSSLRTTIERAFGCWKSKFYTIQDIPVNVPWETQVGLVAATMAIHNFIRKVDRLDEDFLSFENEENFVSNEAGSEQQNENLPDSDPGDQEMDRVRDDICTSIAFSRIGVRF